MNNTLKILILKGIPASGKSTYAKQLVKANPDTWKRVNRDDLRHMLDEYHFSKENEKFVKALRDHVIMEALRVGRNVVVDDTNISKRHTTRITDLSREHFKKTGVTVEVEVKTFEISLDEAVKRDSRRDKPVGKSVITKMHNQLHGVKEERGPMYAEQDKSLQPAIICDLDGTLALMNGRNPFDASTCENDLLNEPVAHLVKSYAEQGTKIILLSGRTDNYKAETLRWLEKHDIQYEKLLMRRHGDSRKDAIIKKEIVDYEIIGKYFVRFVLDDRNQVVDMWRNEIGYACLQVYYGDF